MSVDISKYREINHTCWSPSGSQDVNVATTDTAVADLNVDIVFVEWLGVVALPDYLALSRVLVETAPSFELAVACHFG